VRVPADRLIGRPGEGLPRALRQIGDTRLAAQHDRTYDKIVQYRGSFVGLCGSAAHQLVFDSLLKKHDDLDLTTKSAIFETFRKLHPILKEQHFLNPKEEDDDPYESSQFTALIANEHGIFGVYSMREVFEYTQFWAAGSGREFALGAMHAQYSRLRTAVAIARAGVEAGALFERPPLRVLQRLAAMEPALASLNGAAAAECRRRILQRNLFGVDRNAAAVRLTELRLWLAVIADDRQDRPERVAPLPNLDCLIRQGDSLFEPFASGVTLRAADPRLARQVAAHPDRGIEEQRAHEQHDQPQAGVVVAPEGVDPLEPAEGAVELVGVIGERPLLDRREPGRIQALDEHAPGSAHGLHGPERAGRRCRRAHRKRPPEDRHGGGHRAEADQGEEDSLAEGETHLV